MTTQKQTFEALKAEFGYKNIMQAPKITKIIVTSGVGSVKDKKKIELIEKRLATITGQAPAKRQVKKSIANFKTRRGDLAGFQITLRGARAKAFFDKLIHIVFPRVKDFRGLSPKAFDAMGNITIGLKENNVFPECSDEDAKDLFGLAINISTSAKSAKEAEGLLRHLGLPLKEN